MGLPRISVAIGNDAKNVSLVGAVVRIFCKFLGLTELETHNLELAVAEAVNNAILHGCRHLAEAEIRVTARCLPGAMVIERRDPGIPIAALPESYAMPDPLAESGRGWPLIYSAVDLVEYRTEDGINILTLTKYLPV